MEVCKYFQKLLPEELAIAYGMLGGTPQYLWHLLVNGKAEIDFTNISRWWGTDSRTKEQIEIDILGTADKDTALFGECKWTNQKVDVGVLQKMIRKSEIFHYTNKHYYLFAKNGFTDGCIGEAERLGNVSLISFEDIVKGAGK